MLLSRFWFFILALGAGIGIASSVVAVRWLDGQARQQTAMDLARDRQELELLLKIDARARLDAISGIAAHGDIRSALREANARGAAAEVPESLRTRLSTRLGELNAQLGEMAGDFIAAVDQRGIIAGQVGLGTIPASAGLAAFPAVSRALSGYMRDDVWTWNGELYRIAARPVIEGGQFIGAIIHAKRLDDAFASRVVSNYLHGASLGFFIRNQIVASGMPEGVQKAPRRDELAQVLPTVLEGPLSKGEASDVQELSMGGLAIYAPLVGSAGEAGCGYVVARPLKLLASPWALLSSASQEDWKAALPTMLGAIFGLLALGMLFVYLERDRPLVQFRKLAQALGKGESERFALQDMPSQFRTIGSAINDAIDRLQEQAGQAKKRAADLNALLSQAPSTSAPSFFGFASSTQEASSASPSPSQASPPQGAAPPPPLASPKPAPPSSVAKPIPPPPAPPKTPPQPSLKGPAPTVTGSFQISPLFDDEEEERTLVSQVPQDLIRQSARESGLVIDEAHFREIYEQYIATKQQCGESVAGLTYEKFREQLLRNQEKIQKTHGATKVRFTVYLKDGKASLKATPIK
ncbi:MAG: hypothetical protein NZM37_05605 [Sandaracinaceae bacterium]|nr:hypothetical protein [Sandaracinaceae bacterium]